MASEKIMQALRKRKHPVGEIIETIVVALGVAMLIRHITIGVYVITGHSMEPTLSESQRLLVNKFVYCLPGHVPKPGKIVVFGEHLNSNR